MQLGAAVFATDRSWPIAEVARAVEDLGLDSLAVPEHTHMPVEHTPHPSGGPLGEEYRRLLDPFVALSVAAAVTSRIRLTTALCLLAQHDPIAVAKAVASLDQVSHGRVTFGVGYGWNAPEVEHHGVAFGQRRAVVRERIEVARALWTREEASFAGTHHTLSASWAWPKPVQQPHPPVLIGAGLGPRTLQDLVAVADGWMPLGLHPTLEGLGRLREAWEAAGRAGAPHVHALLARTGTAALEQLAEAGVDAVSVWLPSAPREQTQPALEALAAAARELTG